MLGNLRKIEIKGMLPAIRYAFIVEKSSSPELRG
jgi:hypothetical protein